MFGLTMARTAIFLPIRCTVKIRKKKRSILVTELKIVGRGYDGCENLVKREVLDLLILCIGDDARFSNGVRAEFWC